MSLVRVAAVGDLPPGTMTEVTVSEQSYAVCNVEGEFHAIEGVCPHSGGPLAQGALHGSMVVCPWHAWEFDCRSGAHDYNPSLQLAKFPVVLHNGDVYIEIP